MGVQYKGKEDVTDSVGLLISILVRYPEVATIDLDPGQQIIKFTFIASGTLDEGEMACLKEEILDSIEVFNMLEGRSAQLSQINHHVCEQLTMLEVERDVDTLKQEEIALIVELIHQKIESSLVTDDNENLFEEDLLIQEEIIKHMLESVRDKAGDKNLYAFREEGRVLVFNK